MTEYERDDVHWRKSSYSGGVSDQCVEVAGSSGGSSIRDSKSPAQRPITMSRVGFAALLAGLKDAD